MSETTRHSDKCEVKCVANKRIVIAEIMDFNESRNMTVVLNKSIKLHMTWNGRVYEGRNAGLDFESNGPTLNRYKSSRG